MRLLMAATLLAALAPPAAADSGAEADAWTTDARGGRFRIGFDPGDRLFAGIAAGAGSDAAGAVLEAGLLVRAPPPPPSALVFWKRDHEIGRLWLRPADGWLDGRVYRGTFLRHARDNAITIPTAPPLRLSFPLDVGVK